jgi:hypothetical protein
MESSGIRPAFPVIANILDARSVEPKRSLLWILDAGPDQIAIKLHICAIECEQRCAFTSEVATYLGSVQLNSTEGIEAITESN